MSVSRCRWLHRPWFAARFSLQTRHGVCRVYQMAVLVCWLGNVSTHDARPNVPASSCIPSVLVHGLIPSGRRFVSHIFIPSISPVPFSSLPSSRVYTYHCRIKESRNFFDREFYRPNFISGRSYEIVVKSGTACSTLSSKAAQLGGRDFYSCLPRIG